MIDSIMVIPSTRGIDIQSFNERRRMFSVGIINSTLAGKVLNFYDFANIDITGMNFEKPSFRIDSESAQQYSGEFTPQEFSFRGKTVDVLSYNAKTRNDGATISSYEIKERSVHITNTRAIMMAGTEMSFCPLGKDFLIYDSGLVYATTRAETDMKVTYRLKDFQFSQNTGIKCLNDQENALIVGWDSDLGKGAGIYAVIKKNTFDNARSRYFIIEHFTETANLDATFSSDEYLFVWNPNKTASDYYMYTWNGPYLYVDANMDDNIIQFEVREIKDGKFDKTMNLPIVRVEPVLEVKVKAKVNTDVILPGTINLDKIAEYSGAVRSATLISTAKFHGKIDIAGRLVVMNQPVEPKEGLKIMPINNFAKDTLPIGYTPSVVKGVVKIAAYESATKIKHNIDVTANFNPLGGLAH